MFTKVAPRALKLPCSETDVLATMSVTDRPGTSLLQSVLDARATREAMSVAVLEKSQDVMKQQGEAMVQLLEQAGTVLSGRLLDAYA